jgi:hypothetical protein
MGVIFCLPCAYSVTLDAVEIAMGISDGKITKPRDR